MEFPDTSGVTDADSFNVAMESGGLPWRMVRLGDGADAGWGLIDDGTGVFVNPDPTEVDLEERDERTATRLALAYVAGTQWEMPER
jgi:hypothetical protein